MLTAKAHSVLAEQIESLTPNAAALESYGVQWQTAAILANFIITGAPNISDLRDCGMPSSDAISICTAISQRHARRMMALAAVRPPQPLPVPTPPKPPKPAHDEDSRLSALSLLHDFCLQMDAERGDATVLHRAGFSWATAKELADLINEARTF